MEILQLHTPLITTWHDTWTYIDKVGCCFDKPNAAIAALQWGYEGGMLTSLQLLNTYSFGIYVPLAWLLTIVFCFWFLIGFLQVHDGKIPEESVVDEKCRLAVVLIFQFVMICPLFLLGWDFGRWIFLWTVSSVIVYSMGFNYNRPFIISLYKKVHVVIHSRFMRLKPRYWYLLVFAVPGCCWTVNSFVRSTPLGFFIDLFY